MKTRLLIYLVAGATVGIFISVWHPINNGPVRVGLLISIAIFWVGVLTLAWKKKPWRIVVLVISALVCLPFLLPGREIDAGELREMYVRQLNTFEGTPYIWGGENRRGVDCSGFPRRALQNALFLYGLKNFDGGAVRMSVDHWWHDTSAKALGQGYRGYTVPLSTEGKIEEMEYSGLVEGDLAVTKNGMHVIVYAGDGKWIQSAPEVKKVATLDGKEDYNAWFKIPVRTHRWSVLSE